MSRIDIADCAHDEFAVAFVDALRSPFSAKKVRLPNLPGRIDHNDLVPGPVGIEIADRRAAHPVLRLHHHIGAPFRGLWPSRRGNQTYNK
jgi:hypothetical protein